jgi:hypothetical protein
MRRFWTENMSREPSVTTRIATVVKAGLSSLREPRLRLGVAGSVVMLSLIGIHVAHIFLPGEISGGEAQQDYAAFYGAAKAALAGAAADIYDPQTFQQAIGAETTLLWLYPPPMLFALAPFGLLPYGAAKILWVLIGLGAAFAIGRTTTGARLPAALLAISPASFAALYVGQVSAVFALLLTVGLMLSTKRPLLAGACFALLTIKAQYGLMVIPFLIAMRAWKAMAAAAIFSIVMIGLSALVFGADMWRAFFDSLLNGVHASYYQSGGHPGRVTLSDAFKAAGLAAPPALALYGPLIAAAVAGLFVIARRAPAPLVVAYTLAASALVSPYLFVYDYFMFNAAILIVAATTPSIKPHFAYALIAVWFAPIAPFIGGSPATPAFLWPLSALATAVLFLMARESFAKPAPAAVRV